MNEVVREKEEVVRQMEEVEAELDSKCAENKALRTENEYLKEKIARLSGEVCFCLESYSPLKTLSHKNIFDFFFVIRPGAVWHSQLTSFLLAM